ncbi:MAG: M48 family metalloprotease [Opitutales bacterium]|nr:M48 family metalloprotease [Opitutales bacterium]
MNGRLWRRTGSVRSVAVWLLAVAVVAGCAGPRSELPRPDPVLVDRMAAEIGERRVRLRAEDSDRLFAAGFPLAAVVARHAPDFPSRPAIGVRLHDLSVYDKSERDAAAALFGAGDQPSVAYVIAGSPAESAGLRTGDVLLAVDGRPVEGVSGASQRAGRAIAAALAETGEAVLTVERGGEQFEFRVGSVRIADIPVRLRGSNRVNAWALGRRVEINAGMLRFVENEHELAFVIAHEMAHNALRHHRAVLWNYLLGTAGDGLLALVGVFTPNLGGLSAAAARSEAFEYEADLFALRWMAEAGFDPQQALDLWPRLAARSAPPRVGRPVIRSHPPAPERAAFMRAVADELRP